MAVFLEKFILSLLVLVIGTQITNTFLLPDIWRISIAAMAFCVAIPVAFFAHALNRAKVDAMPRRYREQIRPFLWAIGSWPATKVILIELAALALLHLVPLPVGFQLPDCADEVALTVGMTALWVAVLWGRLATLMKGKNMWPVLGLIAGGLLFLGCSVWLFHDTYSTMRDVQTALKRYVLPRRLTEKQVIIISDHLKKYTPAVVKIIVVKGNSEAAVFADDIRKALAKGGWTVLPMELGASDDLPPDISLQLRAPQGDQTLHDQDHPASSFILKQALDQARIFVSSMGSGSDSTITHELLIVQVGHRRMDDGYIAGKKAKRENALHILKDMDDDD